MNHLLSLLLFLPFGANPTPSGKQKLVDLEGIRKHGSDWQVVSFQDAPRNRIVLHHDKWLMYFLHWRPLTTDRKKISAAYAEQVMKNFWGPQMPFTILAKGGGLKLGGHDAYYVDGTLSNGRIRTRFVIWNCPQTNRQFIADCNINKALNTPDALLELQYAINRTISCHGQPPAKPDTVLAKPYHSKPFQISFLLPQRWNSEVFVAKKWFPKGLTKTNGSLWTLPTDSEAFIELKRLPDKGMPSAFRLRELMRSKRPIAMKLYPDAQSTLQVDTLGEVKTTAKWVGMEVEWYLHVESKQGKETERFVGRAYLWRSNEQTYLMRVGLIAHEKIWHRKFDLRPSAQLVEQIISKQVLPHVRVFPN